MFAASYHFTAPAELEPTPGSLSSTLKVSSLNNILKLGAPLSANKLFKNQTYDFDVHKRGFLGIYDLKLSQIHSNDVSGFSDVNLGFINGTDDL